MSTSSSPRIPPLNELSLASPNLSPSSSAFTSTLDPDPTTLSPPTSSAQTANVDPSDPEFEYGEQVYLRRRAAWLAMGSPVEPAASAAEEPSDASSSGGSMSRLEALLDGPSGSDVGEQAWRSGLEGVHRGLLGGRRLVKRMKLGLVIKVLRAGWIRDGTWPASLPPVPPSPPFESTELPVPPPLPHASSSGTALQSPPTSITLPPAPSPLMVAKSSDLLSPGSATSETGGTVTTPGSITTPGSGTAETTPDVERPPAPKRSTSSAERLLKLRAEETEGEGTPTDQGGQGV